MPEYSEKSLCGLSDSCIDLSPGLSEQFRHKDRIYLCSSRPPARTLSACKQDLYCIIFTTFASGNLAEAMPDTFIVLKYRDLCLTIVS